MLSLGGILQLCRVRSFYIVVCTNWMNLFNTMAESINHNEPLQDHWCQYDKSIDQPGTVLCVSYSCSICQLNKYIRFTWTQYQLLHWYGSPGHNINYCIDTVHLDTISTTALIWFTWTQYQLLHWYGSPGHNINYCTDMVHLDTISTTALKPRSDIHLLTQC